MGAVAHSRGQGLRTQCRALGRGRATGNLAPVTASGGRDMITDWPLNSTEKLLRKFGPTLNLASFTSTETQYDTGQENDNGKRHDNDFFTTDKRQRYECQQTADHKTLQTDTNIPQQTSARIDLRKQKNENIFAKTNGKKRKKKKK